MAMEAEWHQRNGDLVDWECERCKRYDKIICEPEKLSFLKLPSPDRVFTNAFHKKYQSNGNFKYQPGTYIQVANGCWYGKCSFCIEQNEKWEIRPVESVIEELKGCEQLGFKEVFDDSATFPIGEWLDSFIRSLNSNRINLRLGCNMRMVDVDYRAMRNVGFRMLLFGLESANAQTLLKINKGIRTEDVKYIKMASDAGLEPHIAVMFGFPWETDEDAQRTLLLVHNLLRRGIVKTAQASFYSVDGIKSIESHRKYVRKIYDVAKSPQFWFNQLKDIKSKDDLKYLWRKIKEGVNLL